MDKRCLIAAYYFPPTGGAGVQRIVKLIKYLARKGWQFTVITAAENSRFQPLDPSLLEELPDNLKTIRIPSELPGGKSGLFKLPFLKNASYWKRWLGAWFAIPDMRTGWIGPAEEAILKELKEVRYDCVMISAPPYSLTLLAAQVQPKMDIPVILDLRDPWSLHPYKIHPTRWHKQKNREMELKAVSSVHYGISAYAYLVKFYQENIPNFKNENWTFIPNGFDEEDFTESDPPRLAKDCLHIGYSGTIHSAVNNPQILFNVIAHLNTTGKNHSKKIVFHHVGKSLVNLQKSAEKYGLQDNIKLWGYQPHREALRILKAMDVLLLLHDDSFEDSKYIVAGKVYEYLRLQKPILALVPEQGEAAELIRETDSGIVISPADSEHISGILREWMVKIPAFTFRNTERFSREFQAQQFLNVFEKAVTDF